MKENFGGDFISISDDEGNSYELEHVDTIEVDGEYYLAFLPADMDEDSEDYGFVFLKMVEGNGDDNYFVVPDESVMDDIYNRFMERLYGDDGEEGNDE